MTDEALLPPPSTLYKNFLPLVIIALIGAIIYFPIFLIAYIGGIASSTVCGNVLSGGCGPSTVLSAHPILLIIIIVMISLGLFLPTLFSLISLLHIYQTRYKKAVLICGLAAILCILINLLGFFGLGGMHLFNFSLGLVIF